MTRTIVHLVDDATPGGVTRTIGHLTAEPALARGARHEVRVLRRGALSAPRLEAAAVVSHLSVNWANLPLLTALRATNPATRILHVEHSYTERFAAQRVSARARFEALMRVAYALFDRVVAVSGPQRDWIVRRGFAPAGKVEVVHPCVDLAPFLALEPSLDGPLRRFAMIGRLDVQKGFDVGLAAFRAAAGPEDRLRIVGEGPERARLERLAAGDDRIVFAGRRAPAEALAEADAVLMPSRWEAFGLVALEAQAAGRLVLVSRADGLAEHVPHGAMSVVPSTPQAWAAAIARARAGDRTGAVLRGRFRARGAGRVFAERWAGLTGIATADPAPLASAA